MLLYSYSMFIPILVCHVWKQFTSWLINGYTCCQITTRAKFFYIVLVIHSHTVVGSSGTASNGALHPDLRGMADMQLHDRIPFFEMFTFTTQMIPLKTKYGHPLPSLQTKYFLSWIYVNYHNCWLIVAIFFCKPVLQKSYILSIVEVIDSKVSP